MASTWRSGSSFLSSLLNLYPSSSYAFEPMVRRVEGIRDTDLIKNIYKCRSVTHPTYLGAN